MKTHRTSGARRQSGWALLETAIATCLLGLLVVAVLSTADTATHDARSRQALGAAERAENAVLGYARTHSRLPAPEEATPNPARPGYIEGWLPAGELGLTDMTGRLRYVVEASLISRLPIYQPDPLDLSEGRIGRRSTVNGFDLCQGLVRNEHAGTALPGGMRLGFAVQQAVATESGSSAASSGDSALDRLWLGDAVSGPRPTGVHLNTRTQGFGEFATRLGCFARLAQLSASVRATAVAIDLLRLARQETAFRALLLASAKDAVLSQTWKQGNGAASLGLATVKLALEVIGMETTTAGTISGALNVARQTLKIDSIVQWQAVLVESIDAGKARIARTRRALADAQAYEQQLQHEVDRSAALARRLQDAGLGQPAEGNGMQ